ncbi:MAG TPA: carboxypeptidase-like regulatory domain-containing protein, partial [Pirellulales bacterium]
MKSACQLALMILFAGASLRLILAEEPLPQTDAASNGRRESAADPAVGMKSITIRGVCVDEKDQPVAKARVRVFRYPSRLDAPLVVADQPTDQDGRFLFDEVPTAVEQTEFTGTGDVCIAATADGFASAIRFMDDRTLLTSLLPIDPFAPPSEHDVVEIALRLSSQAGTLSGTVRDESGKPLAGVTVSLPTSFQQALPGVQSAVTDAAGRYAITDLRRWTSSDDALDDPKVQQKFVVASYSFVLDHPDFARTRANFTRLPQTVDVVLHPPAMIDGTVYDEVTKRPAANVVVSAQGVARSGWYQTRTDGQGRYRLRMTKDHYNIWADADDRIAIAAKAVRAEPGTVVDIAPIPLLRGGFVTGRVLDPRTNQPLRPTDDAPLRVAHYGPARPRTGAAVTSAEVNAAGVFRLRVAPGKNFIYVMSGGFQAQVISIEDGQELRVDLGAAGSGADTDFAADLRLAAELRKQAQLEDTTRKLAPRVRNMPQRQPARPRRGDGPAARLLDRLEAQNAGVELFKDAWLRTLMEIVELGPAAVPELIAELDATEDDMMLRSLGFTLRAIGDQRAVPAL